MRRTAHWHRNVSRDVYNSRFSSYSYVNILMIASTSIKSNSYSHSLARFFCGAFLVRFGGFGTENDRDNTRLDLHQSRLWPNTDMLVFGREGMYTFSSSIKKKMTETIHVYMKIASRAGCPIILTCVQAPRPHQ